MYFAAAAELDQTREVAALRSIGEGHVERDSQGNQEDEQNAH